MSMTAIQLFSGAASPEAQQAALKVLRSGQIASGPSVSKFEAGLAATIGRPHVALTNDMTSALSLALHLAGVKPGDDVLTLAFSCMSSNSAIMHVGARPVWVDLEPRTATMSVQDLEAALTPKSRAVTLYHVAGYPGPSASIAAFCRKHQLALIEDCNNALGAVDGGRPVGTIGDYSVHSFYPNRQVNALEGGALGCPDSSSADRARKLRRFGIDATHFRDSRGEIDPLADIPEIGWSAGFSQLNAEVGLKHLETFPARMARTRQIAASYSQAFSGLDGITPVKPLPGADPAYWTFLMLARERDALLARLKAAGVPAGLLHHRTDDYTGFPGPKRPLPGTEAFMNEMIAIPCGWWLSDEQVQFIETTVRHQGRSD